MGQVEFKTPLDPGSANNPPSLLKCWQMRTKYYFAKIVFTGLDMKKYGHTRYVCTRKFCLTKKNSQTRPVCHICIK